MIKFSKSIHLQEAEQSMTESLTMVALGLKIQAQVQKTSAEALDRILEQLPDEDHDPESDDPLMDYDNGVSEY